MLLPHVYLPQHEKTSSKSTNSNLSYKGTTGHSKDFSIIVLVLKCPPAPLGWLKTSVVSKHTMPHIASLFCVLSFSSSVWPKAVCLPGSNTPMHSVPDKWKKNQKQNPLICGLQTLYMSQFWPATTNHCHLGYKTGTQYSWGHAQALTKSLKIYIFAVVTRQYSQ